uniref:Uncharacterized protein n=1 Tax=Monopterus albus TaxID=43700 RepID=A0A3Q3QZ91_MONAL
ILTKQLKEAKYRLHDNDHKTHLSFILVLVPRAGLAVYRGEMVIGVCLTAVGVGGIYCHCGFDLQLGQLHTVIEDPEELF